MVAVIKLAGIGKAMKISILGSWRETTPDWPMRGTFDEFKSACYEIGRAFGKHRQQIVVGASPKLLPISILSAVWWKN
jgi:hypothetical protein